MFGVSLKPGFESRQGHKSGCLDAKTLFPRFFGVSALDTRCAEFPQEAVQLDEKRRLAQAFRSTALVERVERER
jgi:hypothetical protein